MNKISKPLVVLLWFLAIGTLLFYYRYQIFRPVYEMVQIHNSGKAIQLEFDLSIVNKTRTERENWTIFYDTGRGFNNVEFYKMRYPEKVRPDKFQHYVVILPTTKTVKRLRFDPLEGPGVVLFKNLKVDRFHTETIPLESMGDEIIAINAIEEIVPIENGIRITANDWDSQVVISVNFDKYLTKNRTDYVKVFSKTQIIILTLNVSLILFVGIVFLRKRRR